MKEKIKWYLGYKLRILGTNGLSQMTKGMHFFKKWNKSVKTKIITCLNKFQRRHDSFTYISRSSHRRCSVKRGVLRNFMKFTGKYLCLRFFFNFIKKQSLAQMFSCDSCKISNKPLLQNTSRRMLLLFWQNNSLYVKIFLLVFWCNKFITSWTSTFN